MKQPVHKGIGQDLMYVLYVPSSPGSCDSPGSGSSTGVYGVSTGCLLETCMCLRMSTMRGFVYLSTTSITATYLSIDNTTNC
jgi:hypothetical protein